MVKLVLLTSFLQFIGSFYRHPARLQNDALRQPASESVRIRIGTTVPDPSLRIIILLIFTLYYYIRFRLPTSDRPTHGTPVGKCFALWTHTRPQSSSKMSSKVRSNVSSGASSSGSRSLPASSPTSGWIDCCSGSSWFCGVGASSPLRPGSKKFD